jgi:hypothetical protein
MLARLHDFLDFEWLLAERAEDILSFVQQTRKPGLLPRGDTRVARSTRKG